VEETPRRTRYHLIFAVVTVAAAAFALLQGLVLPVLSTFQRDLHTSQNTVTWALTSYLLSASVSTPILGRIGDMMGKKKVLVVVLILIAIGCAVSAAATNIGVMIIGRSIQGVGGAVLPLAFGIIRDEAPARKIPSSISIIGALGAVGAGAGVVLAGPIVGALDIHWLFLIPGITVALTALAAIFIVPESSGRAPGEVAVVPALLLSGWLVALIVAVSEGQQWGWTSMRVLGLVGATIVLLVAWVRMEVRATQPLIDMRMLGLRAVWTTNLVAFLFGASLYAAFSFIPEFVQTPASAGYGFGADTTASGLFLLPMTVTMFAFGMFSSHAAARIGSKRVLLTGALSTVVSFGVLTFAHGARWEIYLVSALLGIGVGLAFSAMSNRIVAAVPAHQVGVASGMNANIRTIGGAIGAAVVAAVITSGVRAGRFPTDSDYRNGFAVLMLAGILAAVACLAIPRERRDEERLRSASHTVMHGESGLVAGAALVDEL
jgi:MFS family permease